VTDTGSIEIEVRGDLIIATQPATQFFAIYARPNADQPQLFLRRRTDTNGHVVFAAGSRAANGKARERGWIV
jgi:hypothetical protein